MTTAEIAAEVGCHRASVMEALRRHGIEARRGQRAKVRAGQRFGKLVVVRADGSHPGNRARMYIVRCDCGSEVRVIGSNLGATTSCGCHRRRHGHAIPGGGTREYRSWRAMLARCYSEQHRSYPRYGGRGITVCVRWQGPDGFVNFLADMGARPDGKSIDRINNDGNYEPGNCRWATPSEQQRNRSRKVQN